MKLKCGSLIFALVYCWMVALFIVSAQPIPANDAFGYDGAVVNCLLNGRYCNPSLAAAFPISATRVYSGYPPLYQFSLLCWMRVFGTSVLAAMGFHLVLFGLYMLVLLAVLRRLRVPESCIALAGGFLLALTFHDRPDSLAQLLGMMAVYALVRSRAAFLGEGSSRPPGRWTWAMAVCVVLCLCTSLQIGAMYFCLALFGTVWACWSRHERVPFAPLVVMIVVPAAMVAMVRFGFPLLWQGFQEHARQTPTWTGLRTIYVVEVIKVVRAVPGILVAAAFLPLLWWRDPAKLGLPAPSGGVILLVLLLLGALTIVAASLTCMTANMAGMAGHVQPLIVGLYLALAAPLIPRGPWRSLQTVCLAGAVLLGSVRAVGMSTWGIACARDVGCSAAIGRVRAEMDRQPPGATVVLSSAYLYEAARHPNVRYLHSDWLIGAHRGPQLETDMAGLDLQKPAEFILTQFDYYRRYKLVFDSAKSDPRVAHIEIENTAKVLPPDAYDSLQRVVQHISWAPVIVRLAWK
jgi:hypothetical protein